MSNRAKRMARFLEDKLGWSVKDDLHSKCRCGYVSFTGAKFCQECGTKMPACKQTSKAIEELEQAISYALKEREWRD